MKSAPISIIRHIWSETRGIEGPAYLARALLWQARKRLGQQFIAHLPNGAAVKVHPNSVYSGIFYAPWIERKDALFFCCHAHLAATFVDVGSNVGLFSAQLFDRFTRFYLLEPSPATFQALDETLKLNPYVETIARQIAVGAERGRAYFDIDHPYSSCAAIVKHQQLGSIEVDVLPLDDLIPADETAFMLKVDVEGFEEQVFRGAEHHLRNKRIRLAMFERLQRTNLRRLETFLSDLGYTLFYVTEDGSVLRDRAVIEPPGRNLFACPRNLIDNLAKP